MPKFTDEQFGDDSGQLQVHKQGHFGFSAARIEDLGAAEYTLVTIVADRSGSTSSFQKDMEAALKSIVEACQHSDRSDNLLIRLVCFDDTHSEIHGFRQLPGKQQKAEIQQWLDGYDGVLKPGGLTACYDATFDAIEAENNYGQQLLEEDFGVNGLLVVITDGWDNRSTYPISMVRAEFERATKMECMESLVTILVAVGQSDTKFIIVPQDTDRHAIDPKDAKTIAVNGVIHKSYDKAEQERKANYPDHKVVPVYNPTDQLDQFDRQARFSHYVPLADAGKATIARLAQFVSQSISSQSQALGTGGPSQSITF